MRKRVVEDFICNPDMVIGGPDGHGRKPEHI
jgi:hypothetical protein